MKKVMTILTAAILMVGCDIKNADGTSQQLNVPSVVAIFVVVLTALVYYVLARGGLLKKVFAKDGETVDVLTKVIVVAVLFGVITLISYALNLWIK